MKKPATNKKEALACVTTSNNTPARSDDEKTKAGAGAPTKDPEPSPQTKTTTSSGISVVIDGNGATSMAVRGKDGKRRRVPTGKPVNLSAAEIAYLDHVSIPYSRD